MSSLLAVVNRCSKLQDRRVSCSKLQLVSATVSYRLIRLCAATGSKKFGYRTGYTCPAIWRIEGPGPYLHKCLSATRSRHQGSYGMPLFMTRRLSGLTCLSVSWRLASDKGHSLKRRLVDHPDHQGFWFAWAGRCRFSKRTKVEFYE